MADFDAIRKEVKDLEDRHLELSVLVPKLEEQIDGSKKELADIQQSIVDANTELEEVQQKIRDSWNNHTQKIEADNANLESRKKAFEEYKADCVKDIDTQTKLIKDTQDQQSEKQNELDTLLERQLAGEKRLEDEMVSFQKVVSSHTDDVIKFNAEKKQFQEDKKLLEEDKRAVEDEKAALEAQKQRAVEMTTEGESKLRAGEKMLEEAKERMNLVSLKEDEVIRKEGLIAETQKRLRQKEIALNDQQRVFKSQQI